ncbi:nuclear receptor-interacting protein 2 isoform X4 [Castor canadensis]|uniref:Nuclear receptor-interacting protein 2 isoform X4 n=1 Tax=Castor canadensis TaxID=51338 RepID=A0AC58MSL4_CASCN
MSSQQEARRDEGDTRKRGQEAELRDQAHLSRQRHIKQATQFLHKDSADLLPLDSLKRLGTSKDLQPHSVIQRRLVEGNQSWLQGESPLVQEVICGQDSKRKSRGTEVPALLVNCKCQGQVLRVAVDTGALYNQISIGCLSRLGWSNWSCNWGRRLWHAQPRWWMWKALNSAWDCKLCFPSSAASTWNVECCD